MRVVDGGITLRINANPEIFVPVDLPPEVRPCARLGKTGDAVALVHGGEGASRRERASSDSVISALPA